MKQYEIMTIYKVSLGEEKAKAASKEVQDLISSLKGKVTAQDYWGKRNFSYTINNDTEGFYDVIEFDLAAENLTELNNKLNLNDNLVRYLITAK